MILVVEERLGDIQGGYQPHCFHDMGHTRDRERSGEILRLDSLRYRELRPLGDHSVCMQAVARKLVQVHFREVVMVIRLKPTEDKLEAILEHPRTSNGIRSRLRVEIRPAAP